ncbi:MAG: hypothetical protein AABX79_02565 [Nanoarchaeota archaeon]
MALDYITIVISFGIFALYLVTILLSVNIRRKLTGETGKPFVYLIIAILIVSIRRIQQIYVTSEIWHPIPYSTEIIAVGFAFFLFLAVLNFHRLLKT